MYLRLCHLTESLTAGTAGKEFIMQDCPEHLAAIADADRLLRAHQNMVHSRLLQRDGIGDDELRRSASTLADGLERVAKKLRGAQLKTMSRGPSDADRQAAEEFMGARRSE
jgi:hypothetical protein